MEYSKEDLMEAKKQIWGVGENMGTEESKKIWEENAQFWDNAMGVTASAISRVTVLMYGKVSQENYVELTAASAIPNKEIKSPQILRY